MDCHERLYRGIGYGKSFSCDTSIMSLLKKNLQTISAVTTIILAAATNRKALSLVQEELDGIIGQDRFPELGDRVNLPYLSAFIQECMRSRPVVPLGIMPLNSHDQVCDTFFLYFRRSSSSNRRRRNRWLSHTLGRDNNT